jgi:hypothetical protein
MILTLGPDFGRWSSNQGGSQAYRTATGTKL